ncbi:aromatic ring-hydroxylating dioxygenase subunit alpha [Sphingomonas sp. CGMCC 1.13654]|uniref:Aromatic ring-hydroxylating dioxygenase subunit alpha n=1 Tax=Sphingomonas chungangi TaxID=2683589 RepID=A0A838L5N1_9SPHN|nr:aromatic ring-hydroxylating dioxygenase subunit alpha [Sphingomonas chungangi]MBA2933769.1 aromatic ring-hydroxylating dioxygenase subunit alpha [Sphingomonas chungangi]MVW55100.1 Rieske 2Fe-2S domain-containing protein [Sphingomonas chungangi]
MANVSIEIYERMLDHIRAGTTDLADTMLAVPAAHFSSEAHAAHERALFRRQPLVVACASELPEPGSFVTRTVMGTALLVVRQADGRVEVFLNMCRHRGGKVEMAETGRKRFFVCGYHGWSYEREGGLRGIPFEASYGAIDRACTSLIKVASEERHGLIWVDLSSRDGIDLAGFLGAEADRELATFGIGDMEILFERRYDIPANWKLVMDGAYDVLHPQFLHPTGVGKLVESNVGVWKDYGRHGQLFTARRRLAEIVRSGASPEVAWRYFASVLVLYPNALVIPAPDHYEFWTVWPSMTSPSECHVHIRFLLRPETATEEVKARVGRSLAILEEAAINEDWPMEETIQANAGTSPEVDFLYGRSEVSCQHLHHQLRRDLAGLDV